MTEARGAQEPPKSHLAEATAPKGDELEAPKGDELEAPKTHMQSKSLFGPTKPETTLLDSNLLRAFNARVHSRIYIDIYIYIQKLLS